MASVVNTNRPTTLSSGATASGVLTVNTTAVGTNADTNEKDLWSYTLPANTLNANGKALRIRVILTTAANANNKTCTLYFGATTLKLHGPLASNAQTWLFEAIVYRTGASAELATTQGHVAATLMTTVTNTPAADTTAGIVIRVTGTNGTAVANDILFRSAIVELLN
jgi:hypothetical protein